MIPKELITVLTEAVKRSEQSTYRDIKKGDLSGEENITADLLKSIKLYCSEVIKANEGKFGPYEVATRIFKKVTEEPNIGADFAITVRKFERKKNGFLKHVGVKTALIQSKLPDNSDYEKLKTQIKDMQEYTDESYVAVYDGKGVYVSHSKDVIEASHRVKNVPGDKRQTLDKFFRDIFKCSKGEKGFDARNIITDDVDDIYYYFPSGLAATDTLEIIVTEHNPDNNKRN
ncbi:hypothetical protein ABE67_14150 [Cytobacillus firmus]|uniref:hypothetical protein n=1 Tax=Cytobacillus firmus TaxID=1399 RepID=UPI0018CE8A62|nr:hypothetical protein [Cytobacillus firmus]MBG9450435.1 hypothetical protein [Cytobacillus firmus]